MKRKLYLYLQKYHIVPTWLIDLLALFNNVFFHWDGRCHVMHPGDDDPDKTYYLIRSDSPTEGLCSLFFGKGLGEVSWAQDRGYIAYIDFTTDDCQYHVDGIVHGTDNAWEYYFEQPEAITKDEILKKKNVLLSGWKFRKKDQRADVNYRNVETEEFKCFFKKCAVKQYVWDLVEAKKREFMPTGKSLGVLIRGTDYVALKPKGHPIQPTVNQVISKIEEFQSKYEPEHILVVTEDKNIYKEVKRTIGEPVFTCDENWIEDYKTDDYIANGFKNSGYDRGLNYLVRLLLLSECDYLIAEITSGSMFAIGEKREEYIDKYLFDFGTY